MTTLSGPVGLRNGITPVNNASIDQGKVADLLWRIDPTNGGMSGLGEKPSAQTPPQIAPELAAAIMAFQVFWVARGEFRLADGVVDRAGRTLRKLDALPRSSSPSPPPVDPGFTDLKVLSFQQSDLVPHLAPPGVPAVEPASLSPFLFGLGFARNVFLVEGQAVGKMSQFLFKIKKDGKIFWVGASVPVGTSDFSRAHIFFHPNTRGPEGYSSFSGEWPGVKRRYLTRLGLQMASVKQMTLIVPFTPLVSDTSPTCPLFDNRGVETLNDILTAIQISLGRTGSFGSVEQVGVSSYSSGIALLFSFAQKMGSTGLIREQIDFDSAFIIKAHKNAPSIQGAANWIVTQSAPPSANRLGWVYVPPEAFRSVPTFWGDVHMQLGLLMFKAMMTFSVMG